MKQILLTIGKVMAILGFAALIWRSARSFEKLDSKVTALDGKVEVVIAGNNEIMNEQVGQSIRMDALISNQGILEFNQEALKTSYTQHLAKDRRYEELISYLKLFDFNIKEAVSDTLQFNILIRKKQ